LPNDHRQPQEGEKTRKTSRPCAKVGLKPKQLKTGSTRAPLRRENENERPRSKDPARLHQSVLEKHRRGGTKSILLKRGRGGIDKKEKKEGDCKHNRALRRQTQANPGYDPGPKKKEKKIGRVRAFYVTSKGGENYGRRKRDPPAGIKKAAGLETL